MRDVNPKLAAALTREATTFCHAWKVTRSDGVRLGFTDHDETFSFDGLVFSPNSGAEASDFDSSLGFAPGGADLVAALDGPQLDEEALANGRYDGARVETWLVDWRDLQARLLLDVHALGEVRRNGRAFTVELRGLAHRLDETRGRTFRSACDADLGDARCGVAMSGWTIAALVAQASEAGVILADLGGREAGLFDHGRLRFTSGRHAGLSRGVRSHGRHGALHALSLWTELAPPPAPGDAFELSAGCDKSFATCRDRFANAQNFRGCPHMPGNDYVMAYPSAGDVTQDGELAR